MVIRHNPSAASRRPRSGHECVELSLLLPAEQWAALEQAARRQGMTVGHLLRRLVRDYISVEEDLGSPPFMEREGTS